CSDRDGRANFEHRPCTSRLRPPARKRAVGRRDGPAGAMSSGPTSGRRGETSRRSSVDECDRVPVRTPGGTDAPRSVEFVVYGPIVQGDIPGLCTRVRGLFREGTERVVCDVGDITEPDIVTLDALARLQLAARRRGCRVVLRHADVDLLALLDAAGLS